MRFVCKVFAQTVLVSLSLEEPAICSLLAAMAKVVPVVILYLLLSFPAQTVSVSLGGAVASHFWPTLLAYVVAFLMMMAFLVVLMAPVRGMLVPARGWSGERLHRAHPCGDPARRREPGFLLRLLQGAGFSDKNNRLWHPGT